jgi:hypothetical protein
MQSVTMLIICRSRSPEGMLASSCCGASALFNCVASHHPFHTGHTLHYLKYALGAIVLLTTNIQHITMARSIWYTRNIGSRHTGR